MEIELDGPLIEDRTKVIAVRGRLLRRIEHWNDALRAAYTRACADCAHELPVGASPPLTAWDAVIEPSLRDGPALLGFLAARIAEERGGAAAYAAERERQAAWLAARLGL